MTFYVFTFRSKANGNCLFSAFSIPMCGDNRYVNQLRILTVIELYVNPWFYSQHPTFTLLLNNNQFSIMFLIPTKLNGSLFKGRH